MPRSFIQIVPLMLVWLLVSGCSSMPKSVSQTIGDTFGGGAAEAPAPVEERTLKDAKPATARNAQTASRARVEPQEAPTSRSDEPVVRTLPSYQPAELQPVPAPDTSASVTRKEAAAGPSAKPLQAVALPSSSSTAVVSLVKRADMTPDVGRSAAVLERALRIEPDNAVVWHRLAQVRMEQGRYVQAEAVAMKSNALAIDQPALWPRNWGIIAQARDKLGDRSGATTAREKQRAGVR